MKALDISVTVVDEKVHPVILLQAVGLRILQTLIRYDL